MIALVRDVPDSFVNALAQEPRRIYLSKARKQHARYIAALEGAGLDVRVLPPDETQPDCPFIEDQAVIYGGRALVTRPGHPDRRGESGPVEAWLRSQGLDVTTMEAPATLDGGDVLIAGDAAYVGRSGRTNGEGIARFAAWSGLPVHPVPVSGLHLKSVASAATPRLVLVAANTLDPAMFGGCDVVVVPPDEAAAANVVPLGSAVLALAGHPVTRQALEERRLEVIEVGISEFRKADGSLSCLSVLLDGIP
ncbi:MAG: N(G),N(G)-dimethylarginine dimethylaminohydrolase [Myxococcota bacterium]